MAKQQPVSILVPFCYRAVDYSTTENLLRSCEGIPVGKVIFSYLEKGESLLDYFYRLKEVPCGDASQGVWKISSPSQLTDVLEEMGRINEGHYSQNEHISNATFLRDFILKILDVDHYPMVLRNTIIVEPYIDAPAKVCVDGCVYNKEIIHWAISDSLHWPGQDIPFQGSYMPSTLPDAVQRRLWGGFDKVVGRMVDHGFNNQFVHVEYFILADGQIKLIEVNARMSGNLSGLYAACLSGPLPLQTLLGLCCGVRPVPPVPTGRAALNLPLQVRGDYTGKVGDMVNKAELEILKKDPDVKITWVMSFDEEFLLGKTEFAKVWTYGATPDDAKKKYREVMQRVVPCGDASQGVWKISSASQLTDVLEKMGRINEGHYSQNEHISNATFMRDFILKVLDVDHYPMVLRNTIIVETYIDAPAKVCVDGCVYNKEIIHWAISDSLHWPGQDISFQGSYMPSALPDAVQKRLWGGFDKVVGRMVDHGFNNQFVHVEYFILADGQIKLIEVNARMSGNLSGLYAACLSGPLPVQVLLGLCCGVRPVPPVPTGRAALNLPLQVRGDYTGKVGDMVNKSELEILKKDPDVKITWVMSFDEEFLLGKTEFAKVWTYGATPDDAKKKYREVMQRVVKTPEHLKFNFP
ncbi:PREDICTED: uncharacterized protein LOC109479900 [Branchiostoma belcheri]|uniref:Uncharacterized protein LOC109479900 n=1 Tax=Branchiostoma belcheri TaxID=7741 RepID=A0A6P5A6U9_BRABE|nr:PREDICTED: uncharacterized protein LOC109479900 [Branchiostoma belcheri]